MSDFYFAIYSLKSRFLNSFLSILLTAFGVSIALLVTQFGNHVQKRLNSDGKNIDFVVGAKGSPLQLILSSIYHVDLPTGNIPYESAKKILKHPQIKNAIPIALGDNWKGYRIVGTTEDYIKIYDAEIQKGEFWSSDFQIVVGYAVNLELGDKILGSHGFFETDHIHDNKKYTVVGILKPTGSVIDRLIMTSVNSVLNIHGLENIKYSDKNYLEHDDKYDSKNKGNNDSGQLNNSHTKHKHNEPHENKNVHQHSDDDHSEHRSDESNKKGNNERFLAEITAFLVITKTPIANVNLPRQINRETNFQAANPAIEITRLTSILGFGSKGIGLLSSILLIISILSIFSGLASNLQNRLSDLAILRAIGYSKKRIFKIITLEGMIIVTTGLLIGIILGITCFKFLTEIINPLKVSFAQFNFNLDFFIICFLILFAGFLASIFPAYVGSKISVADQLSKNV